MPVSRYSTGNRFVAIPDVLASNCGALDISFLSMRSRAVLELHGTEESPFLQPMISIAGRPVDLSSVDWEQEGFWIPSFHLLERGLEVRSRVFAPLGQRGFIWVIELASRSDDALQVEAGWRGQWKDTYHVVNLSKPVQGSRYASISPWYGGIPVVEFRSDIPRFAVAFHPSEPMLTEFRSEAMPGTMVTNENKGEVSASVGEGMNYAFSLPITLAPGEQRSFALYVGLGLEETSAVSSAIDIERRGWENLYVDLAGWLEAHKLSVGDEQLDRILNLNAFYNYFYSQGMTLDTEDLVLVTGRSGRHDASATYKDRDAMRWSLPSVLQISPSQARRMIEYAFTIQLRNVGIHSRFIDGIVMHPGFQFDELCAPIRALHTYVRTTHDMSILFDRRVQSGINRIRHLLGQSMNASAMMYETMLSPSGEMTTYPYLTYNNVLAWRAIQDLAWMYELIHDIDRSEENAVLARQVHKAISENCVVQGPFGPMFAYSVDLQGNFELKDDPFGSLQLLSWYEFCPADSPTYANTLRWIHSSTNPYSFHDAQFAAPGSDSDSHPHLLSVANDLLTGRIAEAVDFLRRAEMDDGIACLTVDETTGKVARGRAFASCAGYLAFALSQALGASAAVAELEPSNRLYEPPPPEIRDGLESTRL